MFKGMMQKKWSWPKYDTTPAFTWKYCG